MPGTRVIRLPCQLPESHIFITASFAASWIASITRLRQQLEFSDPRLSIRINNVHALEEVISIEALTFSSGLREINMRVI
jgi:hypothetical protein